MRELPLLHWRIGFVRWSRGEFLLRLFGIGLHVLDRAIHRPLFSVRNRYVRELRIGRWGVRTIPDIRGPGPQNDYRGG